MMLISSILNLFKPGWIKPAALLTSTGAALFFVSDYLLVRNRFISASRFGRLPTMITYHVGQVLIISRIVLQNL